MQAEIVTKASKSSAPSRFVSRGREHLRGGNAIAKLTCKGTGVTGMRVDEVLDIRQAFAVRVPLRRSLLQRSTSTTISRTNSSSKAKVLNNE